MTLDTPRFRDLRREYYDQLGERPTGAHRPETLQGFALPVVLFRLRANRVGEGTR